MGINNLLYLKYNLSARTGHALDKGNINTMEQLKSKSDYELLSIKGLGRKSLNELKDIIEESEEGTLIKKKAKIKPFTSRHLYIYRERVLIKRTLRDVAEELNLTPERIRQITFRINEKIERKLMINPRESIL